MQTQSKSQLTAAVKQIDAIIGEDFMALGQRETEAMFGYAKLEQQCQRQKKTGAGESSCLIAAVNVRAIQVALLHKLGDRRGGLGFGQPKLGQLA